MRYRLFLPLFFCGAAFAARVELDLNPMRHATTADAVANTSFDIGGLDHLFDGHATTIARTPGVNPLVVTLLFSRPHVFTESHLLQLAGNGRWIVEAAASAADLAAGDVSLLFPARATADNVMDTAGFGPISASALRLTVWRTTGDNYVHVAEWRLFADAAIDSIAIVPAPLPLLHPGQTLQLAVRPFGNGGTEYRAVEPAAWSSSNSAVLSVNAHGLATAYASGSALIAAQYAGRAAEAAATVAGDPRGNDISVRFIKRLPEIDYVRHSANPAVEGWPADGQEVTWRAWVRNWSTQTVTTGYRWKEDGSVVAQGAVTLPPLSDTPVDLPWQWRFSRRHLEFAVGHEHSFDELDTLNNRLSIYTDALAIRFWVEESIYRLFHAHQHRMGPGRNSWDDWAQYHARRWNAMLAEAVFPETPEGVLDRIRIDSIAVVADHSLPLAGGLPTNNPNLADRGCDLQWGFPASLSYPDTTTISDFNNFFFEGSLFHELGHARYLIDIYGFNVHENGSGTTVAVTENGSLVAGTPLMPLLPPWQDAVFLSRMPGLMNGGYTFIDRYSAAALNLIAGHRAVDGNCNAPGNLGIFMDDIPDNNRFTVIDSAGTPLPGAGIRVYRSVENPVWSWYSKHFDDEPDIETGADGAGRFVVGRTLFTGGEALRSQSRGVVLFRIEYGGAVCYRFFESLWCNLALWSGASDTADYAVVVDIPATPALSRPSLKGQGPAIVRAGRGMRVQAGGAALSFSLADARGRIVLSNVRFADLSLLPAGLYGVTVSEKDDFGRRLRRMLLAIR